MAIAVGFVLVNNVRSLILRNCRCLTLRLCQFLDQHEFAGAAAVEDGVDAAVEVGEYLEQKTQIHHCLLGCMGLLGVVIFFKQVVQLAEHLRYVEGAVRYDETEHNRPQHCTKALLVDMTQTALRVPKTQIITLMKSVQEHLAASQLFYPEAKLCFANTRDTKPTSCRQLLKWLRRICYTKTNEIQQIKFLGFKLLYI